MRLCPAGGRGLEGGRAKDALWRKTSYPQGCNYRITIVLIAIVDIYLTLCILTVGRRRSMANLRAPASHEWMSSILALGHP